MRRTVSASIYFAKRKKQAPRSKHLSFFIVSIKATLKTAQNPENELIFQIGTLVPHVYLEFPFLHHRRICLTRLRSKGPGDEVNSFILRPPHSPPASQQVTSHFHFPARSEENGEKYAIICDRESEQTQRSNYFNND